MKILIVEDSSLSAMLIKNALVDLGYDNISIAENGGVAIEMIQKEVPDVIITDIMMPYVSGLELSKWVKDNFENQIKIIVLSSLSNEDIVLESFMLGVDDYIVKPFSKEDLRQRINRFALTA